MFQKILLYVLTILKGREVKLNIAPPLGRDVMTIIMFSGLQSLFSFRFVSANDYNNKFVNVMETGNNMYVQIRIDYGRSDAVPKNYTFFKG